jgi:DNA helicase HerA-like ATPase
VNSAAQTFRTNPKLKAETVITELGVGEALVSFLDEKGTPCIVERAFILPPHSQIGPITPEERKQLMASSLVAGTYEQTIDRESAYELLKGRAETAAQPAGDPKTESSKSWYEGLVTAATSGTGRTGRGDSLVETMTKSAVRTIGTTVGRQLVRGVLGSLLGGRSTSRRA